MSGPQTALAQATLAASPSNSLESLCQKARSRLPAVLRFAISTRCDVSTCSASMPRYSNGAVACHTRFRRAPLGGTSGAYLRGGCLACPCCQGRMKLLAVVKNPVAGPAAHRPTAVMRIDWQTSPRLRCLEQIIAALPIHGKWSRHSETET